VHNANGILDIDHYGYSCSRFGVEFAYLPNVFEDMPAQVLFDEQ